MSNITVGGIYQHYKGGFYRVTGLATHSETSETLVLYEAMYSDCQIYARPIGMFLEMVEVNGEQLPRFRFVGTCEGDAV